MHILIKKHCYTFSIPANKFQSLENFGCFLKQCREIQNEENEIATKTLSSFVWVSLKNSADHFPLLVGAVLLWPDALHPLFVSLCVKYDVSMPLCQLTLQCTTECRENDRNINICVNYAHGK